MNLKKILKNISYLLFTAFIINSKINTKPVEFIKEAQKAFHNLIEMEEDFFVFFKTETLKRFQISLETDHELNNTESWCYCNKWAYANLVAKELIKKRDEEKIAEPEKDLIDIPTTFLFINMDTNQARDITNEVGNDASLVFTFKSHIIKSKKSILEKYDLEFLENLKNYIETEGENLTTNSLAIKSSISYLDDMIRNKITL